MQLKQLIWSFYGKKINYRLKMKTVCSGWSMLPAWRYALMRLLLLRNAAHVSVEAITLSCCLLSSCLWADGPATPGVYPGGFTLALGSLWHVAQHPQGGYRQSQLLWHGEPTCLSRASHPMHCLSSACSLSFPGRRLFTALPFPWSWAIPFTHSVFSHQNPVAQPLEQK